MATTEQTPVEGFALGELTDDWARHLRAKNLSPETIKSYLLVARNFVDFLAEQGMPQSVAVCSAILPAGFHGPLGEP